MSWYQPPEVNRHDEDGVDVWQLVGDWTRDLPLDVRERASGALEGEVREALVLDLSDVKFIDSWGEEAVCDALQRELEDGRRVAWTRDTSRRSEYEGVKHALDRRALKVDSFPDRAAAVAAVKRT